MILVRCLCFSKEVHLDVKQQFINENTWWGCPPQLLQRVPKPIEYLSMLSLWAQIPCVPHNWHKILTWTDDCDRGVVVSPWTASVLFFFLRSIQTKDWNNSNSVRTKTTSEKRRVEHTTSWLKVGFHVYVYLSPQLTLKQQRCVHERLGSHAAFSCLLNVLNGLLVTMKNRNQKVCFFFLP